MLTRASLFTAALACVPCLAAAQSSSPVAAAFRDQERTAARNLVAAIEDVPADKLTYRPTPSQMSFAQIAQHLAGGNDALCGVVGGVKAPARPKLDSTASKEALVTRLKETFQFCDDVVTKLDDSNLDAKRTTFGMSNTKAGWILVTTGDWEDHYSQLANYMRLNGLVPPTAKPKK